MRFLADAHLGKLARTLRLLGFDTALFGEGPDDDLIALAKAEERHVLTRDRELWERLGKQATYVASTNPEAQAEETVARLGLASAARPFTRCTVCNTLLEEVPKERILERLPPKVCGFCHHFRLCPGCGRLYWQGTHYHRMERLVRHLTG